MKLLDFFRFIESINGMFNLILCSSICDCDTKDHKQDVNDHTDMLSTLGVIYLIILMCRSTTRATIINDNFLDAHYYSL